MDVKFFFFFFYAGNCMLNPYGQAMDVMLADLAASHVHLAE